MVLVMIELHPVCTLYQTCVCVMAYYLLVSILICLIQIGLSSPGFLPPWGKYSCPPEPKGGLVWWANS